jgi:hypothetical protein
MGAQPGNRQDNRQRGNAAQLLEKYKSMARDAQLSGDRVQTEYYLQFADHYFRVLGESRARFEDQRRQRGDDLDDDDGDEEMAEAAEGEALTEERPDRQDRGQRFSRRDQYQRDDREERPDTRRREAERHSEPARMNGGETIPFDVLPPAIGREDGGEEQAAAEETPKRRRRPRPRPPEGEDEIAPAA